MPQTHKIKASSSEILRYVKHFTDNLFTRNHSLPVKYFIRNSKSPLSIIVDQMMTYLMLTASITEVM